MRIGFEQFLHDKLGISWTWTTPIRLISFIVGSVIIFFIIKKIIKR